MKTLATSIVTVGLTFFTSWWVMLAIGIAHGTDDRIPTFGYWPTFWLVMALSSIVSLSIAQQWIREQSR